MRRFIDTAHDAVRRAMPDSNSIAISLAVLLCFGCVLFACAAPTAAVYATGANMQTGARSVELIPMCAWSNHGAVGLWWNSRVTPSRAFANAAHYNAVCVAVPWAAILPARGRPSVDLTP